MVNVQRATQGNTIVPACDAGLAKSLILSFVAVLGDVHQDSELLTASSPPVENTG